MLTLPTGQVVTESVAIGRYAAKLANLYPTDPLEALFVDELIDVIGDIMAPQNPDREVLKGLREKWADGKLKIIVNYLNKKVTEAGPGSFLVGGKLSLADFYVYRTFRNLQKGDFDFIPVTYLDSWPSAVAYVEFFESNPVTAPFKIE